MATTTVTSKGQVTIPKRVRDASGLKPGTDAIVDFENGCAVIRPARKIAKSTFDRKLERARARFKLGMTTDEYLDLIRERRD